MVSAPRMPVESTPILPSQLARFVEEGARSARRQRVRAEKARYLAGIAERRSVQAGPRRWLLLAEAQRLRVAALRYEAEACLHEESVGALRQLARQGQALS